MSKRGCKNWIQTFMDWTMPRSEAPESLLYWCAMFTLACGLRRNVYIPKKYLGSWQVYPSLYVLFVAPQGVVKKSTTVGYAETLLDRFPNLTKAPTELTPPVLLQELAASSDSSVYILASEFGTMMEKAGLTMYTKLIDLYDGKKNHKETTIGRGTVFVESPIVNMLGATTPDWIAGNMPAAVLRGGFSSRIIPIHEEAPRQYMLFHKGVDQEAMKKLEDDLAHDLEHIMENLHGEFEVTEEAQDFGNEWNEKIAKMKFSDPRITGYNNRKPATMMKIAMLEKLAESDELKLGIDDFKKAIKILDSMDHKVRSAYRTVGKNEWILDIDNILQYIRENGPVKRQDLLKAFEGVGLPDQIDILTDSLRQLGDIKSEFGKDYILFTAINNE